MRATINLYEGDCLIEHENIKSGSVDLILTDLPYGILKGATLTSSKTRSNEYNWDLVIGSKKIYKIANRILRKNGKMILFAQEPYTTELINNVIPNVSFNYRMVWEKDDFANALLCNKAPVNYYEDILVFSKNHEFEGLHPLRPYFKNVFEFIGRTKKFIIENIGQSADHVFRFNSSQFDLCTDQTYNELIEGFSIDKMQDYKTYKELKEIDNQFKKDLPSTFNLWEGNKYKSNILKYKKDYEGLHPTQKPVLLLEDLIKTFSNENNLVVDLTMGSGSTGIACINTNRNFIGIELDKAYFEIAKKRLENHKTQLQINYE